MCCFFFQAEDGIRDAQESRGLGDVYKRQALALTFGVILSLSRNADELSSEDETRTAVAQVEELSLIHI